MRYKLKNNEFQEYLDKISKGEFSETLNQYCQRQMPEKAKRNVNFWGFFFPKEDIEEVEEYNPNKWNTWPNITPPRLVYMRFEFHDDDAILRRTCAFWNGDHWTDFDDNVLDTKKLRDVRYRPWND